MLVARTGFDEKELHYRLKFIDEKNQIKTGERRMMRVSAFELASATNRLTDRFFFLNVKSRQVSLDRLFSDPYLRQEDRIGLKQKTDPVTGFTAEQGPA